MAAEVPNGNAHHAPHAAPTLPRTTPAWVALVALCGVVMGLGVLAFLEQTRWGFITTGLRTPGYGSGSWGLYIVFDVVFVGVSFAGITVAAVCRLFDIATLKPITRLAELLTITALLGGACVVLADLGRPAHGLLKLPRYANPSSPFYGTFTLVVAGYMFSSLVYFFLAGRPDAAAVAANPDQPGRWFYRLWASGYRDLPAQRARHHKVSFWLALTILPLLVTAHSTLGFIFGLMVGRPGWYSALQPPAFVVLAGISGTGMLILVAIAFRRIFRLQDQLPESAIRWLGNLLWVLSLVYLYFMIVDEMTATYVGGQAERHVAHEIVAGDFAPLFWITVGSLFLTFLFPFLNFVRGRGSLFWVGAAALFANVAAVLKRVLLVVPSQTHGALAPMEAAKLYLPTWIEYAVILGLVALVFLAMLLFGRFFPLVPTPHPVTEEAPPHRRRQLITLGVALVAASLIFLGLTDSFRLWSAGENDPVIPYAPVIFATGVMLAFTSAAVFEILPERVVKTTWEGIQKLRIHAAGRKPERPRVHVSGPKPNLSRLHQAELARLARLAADASDRAVSGDAQAARSLVRDVQRLSDRILSTKD